NYQCILHSDTVLSIGQYRQYVNEFKTHSIVGAAHNFHAPNVIGFFYQKAGTRIIPFIHGGAQERNMRGGTENIYGIIGLAKALEIAYRDMDRDREHILQCKQRMKERLLAWVPDIQFNGRSGGLDKSLYTVLNVSLPYTEISDMLLFNLDIAGICASGGSACSSGTNIGSHVLQAISGNSDR